jgi:hypothetical protein
MSRSRQLPAVIQAFPAYPGFDRLKNITAKASRLMDEYGITKGKTPHQTAARIMQEYCSDTPKTHKKGAPDLFRRVDGKGWGLRDTHENTYAKAGMKPFARTSPGPAATAFAKDGPMTIEGALAKLPKELHHTYQAFITDYKAACRRAAATLTEKDGRKRKRLEAGIVHHEVFVELLEAGQWRKVIA